MRKSHRFTVALLASASMFALPARAQDVAQAGDEASAPEIIVTGLRASVASAQAIKRNADTIVDSIVAEDVGKFPDQNVVESLARVPGVQIVRSEGEGSSVTIRGLSNVKTVLNGRELFGGNSEGNYSARNFSLGDLPSEVLAGVDVYKTSNADQIEGGLGGYIDVRTRRPFDFSGFTASLSAKGTYFDRVRGYDGKVEPTISGLVSDRWETGLGEFGALLNVSYGKTALTQDRQAVSEVAVRPDFAGSGQTVTTPSVSFLNGTQNGSHERFAMVGSLQWKPSDSLTLYADGYYVKYTRKIDFADLRISMGEETSDYTLFPGSSDLASGTFVNSTINSATAFGDEFRTTQQYALGGEWADGSGLSIKFDASHTSSDNKATLQEWDLSTSAPGMDFAVDGRGRQSVSISGVDLGNAASYTPVYDLSILLGGKQHANTGRVDIAYDVGGLVKSLQAGVRYNEYVAQNQGYVNFLCINGCGGGGLSGADLPSDFLASYPSIAGSFVGWNTSAMRQQDELRAYFGLPVDEAYNNDQYLRSVEKTTTLYGKLSYDIPLGGLSFDGNVGVRYIHTSLRNRSFGTSPDTPGVYDVAQVDSSSRNDVLPSFNGRLKFSDKTWLRLAANKSLERIPFSDLNGAIIITNAAQLEARRGNPDLQPFTSWNFDASLEHYFSRTGLVYLAGFYKRVSGYLQTITLDGQTIPGVAGAYQITTKVNGDKGTLKGFEVGAQTFFEFLPEPFDGLGIQANYTFVDSAVPSPVDGGGKVGIEGLARHSYNLIGLYEKGPISARVAYSWRGKLVSASAPADGAGATSLYPNIGEPVGVLDFSLTYNVSDRFAVTIDGANLLGYKDRGYRFERQTLPTGELLSDRRFGIQARYKL
ncbi:TonB-dependent receptor [Novosphingobium sp. BL-52-GroH]|uniref:TonB-dependent receptor n=1 Tax=Novosphingobium sp. BL-52-GroH TaxID=3349877 RepID=UPI00385147FC